MGIIVDRGSAGREIAGLFEGLSQGLTQRKRFKQQDRALDQRQQALDTDQQLAEARMEAMQVELDQFRQEAERRALTEEADAQAAGVRAQALGDSVGLLPEGVAGPPDSVRAPVRRMLDRSRDLLGRMSPRARELYLEDLGQLAREVQTRLDLDDQVSAIGSAMRAGAIDEARGKALLELAQSGAVDPDELSKRVLGAVSEWADVQAVEVHKQDYVAKLQPMIEAMKQVGQPTGRLVRLLFAVQAGHFRNEEDMDEFVHRGLASSFTEANPPRGRAQPAQPSEEQRLREMAIEQLSKEGLGQPPTPEAVADRVRLLSGQVPAQGSTLVPADSRDAKTRRALVQALAGGMSPSKAEERFGIDLETLSDQEMAEILSARDPGFQPRTYNTQGSPQKP